MSFKSIVFGALVGLTVSLPVNAQTISETQSQLQQLQQQRETVSSQISATSTELSVYQAEIVKAEQQPLPEKAEYIAAKEAAEKATKEFYNDASLNNKAQRDKLLFKLKLAEQKYEKASSNINDMRQERDALAAKETSLRNELSALDTRISDMQKRLLTLIDRKVEKSNRNEDVTALLSGDVSSSKRATGSSVNQPNSASSTSNAADSEGKTWQSYVVIVNPNANIAVDKATLKKLFLDKENSVAGFGRITAINAPENSDSYAFFALNVLEMDQREISKYWAKIVFSGKGEAPKILDNPDDIKRFVANNQDAIGYIPAADMDGSIKGIMSF